MFIKWLTTLLIVLSFAIPSYTPTLVNYLLQEEWCIVLDIERNVYQRLLMNTEEIEA